MTSVEDDASRRPSQSKPLAQASAIPAHLGAGVGKYEFFATSVGSVHGVRLSDDRRVVVKVHRADTDRDHLLAVQRGAGAPERGAFPSPRPILGPTPLAHGLAGVETLLDDGSWADAHEPAIRREMAWAPARLVELCRPLAGLPGLSSIRDSAPGGYLAYLATHGAQLLGITAQSPPPTPPG